MDLTSSENIRPVPNRVPLSLANDGFSGKLSRQAWADFDKSGRVDDWQPLEDLLSSLVEPSAGRLSDDLSDSHKALFSQLGH